MQYPGIITEYLTFLEIGNYSHVNNYRKKILKFHRFLQKQSIDINIFYDKNKERILINQVRNYEVMLSEQIQKEEIKKSTATVYLRSIQLFFKFLYSKKLVHQKYSIPLHLRGRGSQANQYVTKEEIIEIMTAIVKSSNHVSRNLAIFLIIVDTGCRPIEVTNLKITDIDRIERAIFLGCKKTDRRKIKLSTEVMEVTKDFLKIRNEYNPIDDSLFVNGSGVSITSSLINKMFYEANIKAFGKSKHSPKAFRHTFITNALEEYSLQRVSNVIGHKEWRSTYYYYHRSNKRLLKNTVNNSPFKKEGSAENAN